MQHKITPNEATAITKLAVTLQPGWDGNEFLQKLADVREQQDFPAFMAQLTQCALAGLMIEDALLPVVPHECPVSVVEQTSRQIDADAAWLTGSGTSVVNEDDPTKSVLLRKRKPETEIVRPPSDDPNHWRNRFAAQFEAGVQKRISDLEANRAEQLPERPSVEQSAPAAVTHQDRVPAAAPSSPDAPETVPNNSARPDLDSDHYKMLLAAQRKRDREQSGYSGRNAGWNDHNPDK